MCFTYWSRQRRRRFHVKLSQAHRGVIERPSSSRAQPAWERTEHEIQLRRASGSSVAPPRRRRGDEHIERTCALGDLPPNVLLRLLPAANLVEEKPGRRAHQRLSPARVRGVVDLGKATSWRVRRLHKRAGSGDVGRALYDELEDRVTRLMLCQIPHTQRLRLEGLRRPKAADGIGFLPVGYPNPVDPERNQIG